MPLSNFTDRALVYKKNSPSNAYCRQRIAISPEEHRARRRRPNRSAYRSGMIAARCDREVLARRLERDRRRQQAGKKEATK